MKNSICSVIAIGCLTVLLVLQVNAQEFTYKVQQDRTVGHRDGGLSISENGIEYRAEKKEKESRSWNYSGDIKLLEILSPTKIRIWTYKDRKLLLGKDESLTFKIVDGQLDQRVSDFLRQRLPGPFVTSFVEEDRTLLVAIPVKHSHRFGGCEGLLKVYSDRLIYDSENGHDSRNWRWTDIRSLGRSDLYRLDIETFEPQMGASSRSFNFILKQQLPDRIYDLLWARIYHPTPLIRVDSSERR